MGAQRMEFIEKGLYLVDRNDNVIRKAKWEEVYNKKNKGLYTRVVHVWIFKENKLLIQRRKNNLKIYPGFYESSASGHVDFGESYSIAALRELEEETGIKTRLYRIIKIKLKECKNICVLFMGFINKSEKKKIKINKGEVQDVDFYSIREIRKMIKNKKLTPVFKELFKIFFNKKQNNYLNKLGNKVSKIVLKRINEIKDSEQ